MTDETPRLLLVVPAITPSATIYIIKPLEALAKQGLLHFRTAIEIWVSAAEVRAADMVLFCRNIEPDQDWILQECLARHIPTVYDLDDNLWEVPPGFDYSEHHRAPHRIAQLERYLRHVSRVRVYSRPLEARSKAFNPNVVYVRPCIDLRNMPAEPPARQSQKIRLTYVTGRGAVDPLVNLFADDLQRLLDDFPGRFEFTWWGEAPERFRDHPDCRIVPVLNDYAQFMRFLAEEGFDIGLAPLTPTSFNLSKTNTKFRDYGACRMAGVYSAVDVYTNCVEPEKTGLLVQQKPGAWYDAILRLADDQALRQTIQRQAYAEIDAHYRQERAEEQWLETIRELLAQRPICAVAAPNAVLTSAAQLNDLAPASLDTLAIEGALDSLDDPRLALQQAARAVRPGGQIAILAAYGRGLDEHSPRDWSPLPSPVYAVQDNLRGIDPVPRDPIPGVNLRCFSIEFFYRPELRLLREDERLQARRADPALCDALLYRCLVASPSPDEPALEMPAMPLAWLDPPAAAARREQERVEELKAAVQRGYARLDDALRRTAGLDLELARRQAELDRQLPLGRHLAHQVDAFRNRKLLRLIDAPRETLRDRSSLLSDAFREAHLPPEVQRWADDSLLFGGPLDGYRLRPSLSLTRLPALEWTLDLSRPGLRRLSFMPLFDLYPRQGRLRLEIWIGEQRVVESEKPVSELWGGTPLAFRFAPLPAGRLRIVLAGPDLDVPLRVYEWHKPVRFGLGRPLRRPFVGLDLPAQGAASPGG